MLHVAKAEPARQGTPVSDSRAREAVARSRLTLRTMHPHTLDMVPLHLVFTPVPIFNRELCEASHDLIAQKCI